ncbi:MAG: ATP-binding protein, partial [Limnobacter sp.]|nr:ATP-binding protein [Limnobacter sp.]
VIFTPLLMWLAIRGLLGWVCLGSTVLSVSVLRATAMGTGPFVSVGGEPLLFDMNVFLLGLALTAQFVAVLYEERSLYEKALVESGDRERRANRAKTDFLANVSHEIRTPMNAVLGMTSLARKESNQPEVRNMLDDAYRSGSSLLVLLDQILDFSKIESGRMKVSKDTTNLDELLADLEALFKMSARQRGLTFRIEILSKRCPKIVQTDELRLKQVLTNLIGNALKFTEEGSVVLKVHTVEEKDVQGLQFTVCDTGIGLTKEQQASIFEAFVQAESTTSKRFGGTGLGLTISQELVQALGGELRCESAQGEGSRFYFILPVHFEEGGTYLSEGVFSTAGFSQSENAFKRERFAGLRVLVVDDHPLNVKIAGAELASLGAEVTKAGSGQEALEVLQTQEVDVVLLDLQMPDMSGKECALKIRLMSQSLAHQPVVFGFTAATTLHHDDQEGLMVHGVLTKPLDFDEFESRLKEARNEQVDLKAIKEGHANN